MNVKRTLRSPVFFTVVSVIVLFLGYSENLWKATDFVKNYDKAYASLKDYYIPDSEDSPESYYTFDRFSESFVIGRILKSKKDGLLSSGGFVGRYYDNMPPQIDADSQFLAHAFQYKIYYDENLTDEVSSYGPLYLSQSGGQAFVLSIVDKILPGGGPFKLKVYYRLMALLTTLAIFLVIYWFYKEFGALTGWMLVICFALFNYPTLYAKSLWWVLWAFYIPFILILYSLRKEDVTDSRLSYLLIFILSCLGMFIKIFLNGFEFITTTAVMTTIPAFYYALKNKWGFSVLFYRLISIGGGVALSVVLGIVLLSLQFVLLGNNFSDGLSHVYNSLLARTHGTGAYTNWLVEEGVKTPTYEVLKYYLLEPVIFDFQQMGINFQLSIKYLLYLFLGTSIFWMLFARKLRRKERIRKIEALNATMWISVLAPFSWFIVFKGHSYIHKQHDPIVWFMPFMFFGIGMLGITIQQFIEFLYSPEKRAVIS